LDYEKQKMAKILLIYSTTDGHTIKICNRLRELIEQQPHQVTVVSIRDMRDVALDSYDKVVIGASIRYGKHNSAVAEFIASNQHALDSKANAFFSVNIVARKPAKNRPETNPYLQKFLKQVSWKPKELAVFAGKLDYPRYSFFDRMMIRFIMLMTKGPTDPKAIVEFTDWSKVEAFSKVICKM
jgi:menaquinone-dependent protoporphyrinogen oxidase